MLDSGLLFGHPVYDCVWASYKIIRKRRRVDIFIVEKHARLEHDRTALSFKQSWLLQFYAQVIAGHTISLLSQVDIIIMH